MFIIVCADRTGSWAAGSVTGGLVTSTVRASRSPVRPDLRVVSGTSVRRESGEAPTSRTPPGPAAGSAPLTRARTAVGMTMTELAREVHVSRPTVSLWERGGRRPAEWYWPGLAGALGLSADAVGSLFDDAPPSRYDRCRLPALAAVRRATGLTQREVAQRVGVAPTTLSMWESAGVPVPVAIARQLGELLGADLERLARVPAPVAAPDPRPLRLFRRSAGMSQREAAAYLQVAVGSLARYESGERPVPMGVARRMAAAYRRPLGDVLAHGGTQVAPLPPGARWTPADVPQAVLALRTMAGLSKNGLGAALGRSGQAVRSWETGRGLPSAPAARRLEALFGLPPGVIPGSARPPAGSAGATATAASTVLGQACLVSRLDVPRV